jgi:folate-binding protein YgfZ
MTSTLYDLQKSAGATFESAMGTTIPTSFGNEQQAIQAAHEGVALVDRSHWGRLQVSGPDRLNFLHNQSTNDFKRLKPGEGCDTVFVTSTARVIDLASAYVTEDAVMLLVSPERREKLLSWLSRFIFFGDQVEVIDTSDTTATFNLIGPESSSLLKQLGASEIMGAPDGSHCLLVIGGVEVRVAVGSGLASPGYTLITSIDAAATLWSRLVEAGAVPLGEQCWEQLRIQQGRPKPDHEITEDYNPLEASIWQAISLDKGCYIGQETIARLNTYQGVKQQLWGVHLSRPAEPGTIVMAADSDHKVGTLTSFTETSDGPFGLAYIRTKAGSEGLKVRVGESQGQLVDLPFLTRSPLQKGS